MGPERESKVKYVIILYSVIQGIPMETARREHNDLWSCQEQAAGINEHNWGGQIVWAECVAKPLPWPKAAK